MNIFKEDRAIFRSGGLRSAFKWSLLAFAIVCILNFLSLVTPFGDFLFGLLFLGVLPNIALVLIYYFALKRGISKFKLKTYSLRVEYVATITILMMIYSILLALIVTGELEFPRFGILPFIIMLFVPYFIKK